MPNSLIFKMAWRYLISKKSVNAINFITGTAVSGMAVGVMALLLVLSVFNGFSQLVLSLYNQYSPDIQITAQQGKVFTLEENTWQELLQLKHVAAVTKTIEEKAMLKNGDNEYIATVKGVDENFLRVNSIENATSKGTFTLQEDDEPFMVLGAGVAAMLSLNMSQVIQPISIYLPKRGSKSIGLLPSESFVRRFIFPSGLLSVQTEFDYEYVYVPLDFLQEALRYNQEISGIEIKVNHEKNVQQVIAALEKMLGAGFVIKNKMQQDETLFKVMNTERIVAYAIFAFVLIIISFNITGAISMIVLEKKKDIAILRVMGLTHRQVLYLFLGVGLLIAFIGSGLGIVAALFIGFLQIRFSLLKMNTSTMVVDAYPVAFELNSFIFVMILVLAIGSIASFLPASKAARSSSDLKMI